MLFSYCTQRLYIIMAVFILIAVNVLSASQIDVVTDNTSETLVTAEWLNKHLNDSDLVILDCTVQMMPKDGGGFLSTSGRDKYESGHIPSAGFADLKSELCDTDSQYEFAIQTPEEFCNAMGALGVGDDSRVVLYDSFNSVWAARVWWMFRWVGFDQVVLLDGGLNAWTNQGGQLSTESPKYQKQHLTPNPRPELIADRDEVFAAIKDEEVTLIDAMYKPHYHGKMSLYDRPGHIPGAINIPATALIDETGHYLPHDELSALYNGDRNARVITYCGAGVAASSNAFILVRLGFSDVAVYMASLQEWAADPANPLVVDKP